MTPVELAQHCAAALDRGSDTVVLVIPGKPPRAQHVHIGGRRSPRGEVLCWHMGRGTTARFDVLDVLAWMHAIGAIKLATAEGGPL